MSWKNSRYCDSEYENKREDLTFSPQQSWDYMGANSNIGETEVLGRGLHSSSAFLVERCVAVVSTCIVFSSVLVILFK